MAIKLPPEWGAEPVPVEKRILKSIDYFVLWSSLAVGLLVFQAGGLLTPGLSMLEAVAVVLLGSTIGSSVPSFMVSAFILYTFGKVI